MELKFKCKHTRKKVIDGFIDGQNQILSIEYECLICGETIFELDKII